MTIAEIKQKSGLPMHIAEVLYWHSIWLREAKPTAEVDWYAMLNRKEYRTDATRRARRISGKSSKRV